MAKYLRLALLSIMTSILVLNTLGCNTMEGAGEDIERAGEKVQDAADK